MIDEENRFVAGLQELGLHEYANDAIAELIRQYPDVTKDFVVAELRGLVTVGDWTNALAAIRRQPDPNSMDTWSMRLVLARGYFAWGRYPEAQKIFDDFFTQYPGPPPEALNTFFRDAAHDFAQMMKLAGRNNEAARAYETALKAKLERHERRQFMGELAELLLRMAAEAPAGSRGSFIERVRALARDLMWERDLWFGKAVAYLAHIKLLEGDASGAKKMVGEYETVLLQIHEALVRDSTPSEDLTVLSPLPLCHHLLGKALQSEAEKLIPTADRAKAIELLAGSRDGAEMGAVQYFLNVFIRFPNSESAPDAALRMEQAKDLLRREFGINVKTVATPEQLDKVSRAQFRQANALLNQGRHREASESYLRVLTLFPEGPSAAAAVGELARCYAELGEDLFAETAVAYLADRFSGRKETATAAGDAIQALANFYEERGHVEKRDATLNLFFDRFRDHPRIASMIYTRGEDRFKAGDFKGALAEFERVRKEHPSAPVAINAVSRLAQCHQELGDMTNAIATMNALVTTLAQRKRPGHFFVTSKFRLAGLYRELGPEYAPNAYRLYQEVAELVKSGSPDYFTSGEQQAANETLREGSRFYMAASLAQMKGGDDAAQTARKRQAVAMLEQLIAEKPQSKIVPAALSHLGTLHFLLDEPDLARRAFDRLRREFAGSVEAKSASYRMAVTLWNLGFKEKAADVFAEVVEDRSVTYSTAEYLAAGQRLQEAGRPDKALLAFDALPKDEKDPALLDAVLLARGKALFDLKDYAGSAAATKKLQAQRQRSPNLIEALLVLSQSLSEMGASEGDAIKRAQFFRDSVKAMNDGRGATTNRAVRAHLSVGVGRIFVRQAAAEEQFGSPERANAAYGFAAAAYQTIVLGDYKDPALRPNIEQAYVEGIPLLLKLKKWDMALEWTDEFIARFPDSPLLEKVRPMRTQARTHLGHSGGAQTPEGTGPAQGPRPEAPPATNAPAGNAGPAQPPATEKTNGVPAAVP